MKLSDKLKELRSQHGFSQQELARKAQLSLRTIQRIELDETDPRGDTLIRIAEAFNLKPEDLKVQAVQRDKYFLPVLNLSALSFLLFPLLGFIIPLILWVLKRDKYSDADGKRLLNFQITWSIGLVIIYCLLISGKMFHFGFLGGIESMFITLAALYIINFLLIILNTFLSVKNKRLFYQPAIPFLR
ncbi:helix-turn-helix domain-containing protein [Pedobacter mendelii]|uniref:HTH cro/C1-type domain-containing protein n=1 Tax=Pedobacter mendelii TaxID=1908240 RepID=A0ABQ2BBK0_9SPHI|nr:helix-turn-helix domain-containing protein [Pedobacter mendelii]GGI22313.1 hypothetical protein GCM10008119_02020 [Pedobacter mendelii]